MPNATQRVAKLRAEEAAKLAAAQEAATACQAARRAMSLIALDLHPARHALLADSDTLALLTDILDTCVAHGETVPGSLAARADRMHAIVQDGQRRVAELEAAHTDATAAHAAALGLHTRALHALTDATTAREYAEIAAARGED